MDRTFLAATVIFVALAIAGVALTLVPGDAVADASDVHAVGPALLGAGLTAFLVEAFRFGREHDAGLHR